MDIGNIGFNHCHKLKPLQTPLQLNALYVEQEELVCEGGGQAKAVAWRRLVLVKQVLTITLHINEHLTSLNTENH